MSMNIYMHPRNIFRQPPDFKLLALEYPEFRKYVKQDVNGKVSLDFKDLNALRALSFVLLQKHFDLNVNIPEHTLIPTIPLRLNYILWIEDLLSLLDLQINTQIKGIDIGTGASCVYSLIAAKKNDWEMVATEMDDNNFNYAVANVAKNNLDHKIVVHKINDGQLLAPVLNAFSTVKYHFCMLNPPFFANKKEIPPFCFHNGTRARPRNAFCAQNVEVVTAGGEVELVSRLIRESHEFSQRICIFSSMLGHKSSLLPLKTVLRECNVNSFKHTEFCQGHTTRWGLAWTFFDINLRKIPSNLPQKTKQKVLNIEVVSVKFQNLPVLAAEIVELARGLEIEVNRMRHVNLYWWDAIFIAYANTWSHQRRLRRQLKRLQEANLKDLNVESDTHMACEQLADLQVTVESLKRSPNCDSDTESEHGKKKLRTECRPTDIYLQCRVSVRKKTDGSANRFSIDFEYLDGNGAKDALHQLLQYFKNNLSSN